ncbi:MAG TPA: sulfatase-like hydrolase/transferase [Candidatus Acidoferrales bacterium]|nr:sulfatase-like hydrolase/transferase [Candidatus Acidoferrales bacterium]
MKPNVVIIVLDTMRADTFKKLGQKGERQFKEMGFVPLDTCISSSSWTLPSHASLFTGMYPKEHGAHETKKVKSLDIGRIKLMRPTLITDLNEMGYKSYGISANPYIHPIYGFNEFSWFKEESYFTDVFGSVFEIGKELKPLVAKYRNRLTENTSSSTDTMIQLMTMVGKEDPALLLNMMASGALLTPIAAMKKLKAKFIDGWPIEKGGKNIVRELEVMNLKRPFALFVNLMEAHDPYVGKKEQDFNWATPFLKHKVSDQLLERWKSLYNVGAAKASGYAHSIVRDILETYGDNTLIIITSDHGQGLGEHGFVGHGTFLYDELVTVPFLVRLPKGQAKQGKGYISLTAVRGFILEGIRSGEFDTSLLYSKEVYAESYGVPSNLTVSSSIDKAKLSRAERYTKRAFRSR